jgi:hypothetical protein
MNNSKDFLYISKVISSCATYEQLISCENWLTELKLDYDEYYKLMLHIYDIVYRLKANNNKDL